MLISYKIIHRSFPIISVISNIIFAQLLSNIYFHIMINDHIYNIYNTNSSISN